MATVSDRTGTRQNARDDGSSSTKDADGNRARGRRSAVSAVQVMQRAATQMVQLTGRTPDTVSAVEQTDDGWRLEVELVELERVPATTNILATYEVELNGDGDVVGYRRIKRYFRNAAEDS